MSSPTTLYMPATEIEFVCVWKIKTVLSSMNIQVDSRRLNWNLEVINLKSASRQLYILKRDLSVLGRSKRCYLRSTFKMIKKTTLDD